MEMGAVQALLPIRGQGIGLTILQEIQAIKEIGEDETLVVTRTGNCPVSSLTPMLHATRLLTPAREIVLAALTLTHLVSGQLHGTGTPASAASLETYL